MNHSQAPRPIALLAVAGSLLAHGGAAAFLWSQREPPQARSNLAVQSTAEGELFELEPAALPVAAPERDAVAAVQGEREADPPAAEPSPVRVQPAPRPVAPRSPQKTNVAKPLAAPESDGDWLRIEDQLPATASERDAKPAQNAPSEDVLVERILRREREKALERDRQALPDVSDERAAPSRVAGATNNAQSSAGAGANIASADPETALLHALPAAVALAPWSNPQVQPRQVLHLALRFKSGALLSVEGEPNGVAELDSLRRNVFELLRHERFEQSKELKFDLVLALSRVENNSLPALGFSPARLGSDGSAYVIFPSGLRVSMQLHPKALE